MHIEESQDDSDDWMTALLRSPIYQSLPPVNLQKILMSLEAVHFSKGEVIVDQGSVGDYYYLIKNGHCELTRKPSPNAKEIKLARLSSGDTFGEDSLLSDAPRNVTITALTDISLLRLNKQNFLSLIKEPTLKFVEQEEMKSAADQGAMLLDVRSPDDFEKYHLPGSINEPFFSLRMQLKTLDREKPIIVICDDGKTSEAAVFLLLRNKINAKLLKGGLNSIRLASETVNAEPTPPLPQTSENAPFVSSSADNSKNQQVAMLKAEIDTLKQSNLALNDKCMKLEFDKQNLEKQNRILHKQLEKLTQVLDKFKGVG